MMSNRFLAVIAAALAGCAGGAPVAAERPARDEVPLSDPHEYAIDRITRDAGRKIFERTGIGDPYRTGIPYPMFLALLAAYPDRLGATTAELAQRFGFVPRASDPRSEDPDVRAGLPVGMHLTTDPLTSVQFVVTNCALCHAERVRWDGGEALVVGLGNKRVRIHAYDRAFAEITRAPRFNARSLGMLATKLAEAQRLAWPEAYREVFAAATVKALAVRAESRAELHAKTSADPPGRVAVIESFAYALGQLAGKRIELAPAVGWAKVPDVIGYGQRTTLSWDASQEGPIDLLVVEADLAAGVRVEWFAQHPFQGPALGAYLRQPAPRPKFPGLIDTARAEHGKRVFDDHCASCHGTYAADGRILDYEEAVIPVEDLGTDPARLLAPTAAFEAVANDPALTHGFTRFKRSAGYVPPILTNVWARAPYGHAGQWPSLAVLATPPEQRPTRFTLDLGGLYDLENVGVALRAGGYVQDSFSVLGHPYLAALGEDAAAVIEYLKTL